MRNARKHILIENEWKEKKKNLEENIQNIKNELKNYSEKDKSYRKLSFINDKQVAEEEKFKIKQEETLQAINSEISLSNSNIIAAMKHLNTELQSVRSQLLAKEANQTRNDLRFQKNKGDRNISKVINEISRYTRSLAQTLSQLTESKLLTVDTTLKR